MASGARGQPRSAGLAPGPDPASSPTSGGCARSAGADSRAPSRVGSGSCDSAPAALAPRTFLLGMVAAAGGGNVDAERGDAVARGFGRSRGRSRLLFTLLSNSCSNIFVTPLLIGPCFVAVFAVFLLSPPGMSSPLLL
jgi:hypothetical protein